MPVFNQSRKNVIRLIVLAVVTIIVLRLFYLQVIETKYKLLADAQAIQRKIVYPSRGIIYDRNGKVLVNNDALYDLTVTPVEVKNIDTAYFCQLLGIDTAEFRQRMVKAVIKNSKYRASVFAPLLYPDVYGRLQENIYQFPGFDLVERPIRNYPYQAAAHIFGYIGEVDSATIRRSDNFYQAGDFVGKNGLEKSYESVLMGQRGISYIVRDSRNRPQGPYANGIYDTAAIAGNNLHLSLDINLQQLGEQLMKNKIGAIVAIDPQTGGILSLVSSPDFDPSLLRGSDRSRNYGRLFVDPELPLFNRAIQATYPPGSTFKPIDALVALHENVVTPSYGINCTGLYYGCGTPRRCTEHWAGHASNMMNAITYSCNSYFFQIFRFIIDKDHDPAKGMVEWNNYMHEFGLGRRLGVDLPGEYSGYIPDTAHYNKVFGKNRWNSCTAVSLGIGQGEITETPLQIANAMCIIGNHGYYYTPHLVSRIDGDSSLLEKYKVKHEVAKVSEEDYQIVTQGMAGVIERGTGRIATIPGIEICGKTGTAQNFAVVDGKRVALKDHSIFAAFAPREHPRIAIAVVVENAGYGATWAAPIASLMMEKYLKDTIAVNRQAMLTRVTEGNLIPAHILRAKHRLDSLNHVRDMQEEEKQREKLPGNVTAQNYNRR